MENEEKIMTGEESLRVISSMINKTKLNISQGSFHLLFWGWLIAFCGLGEFVLYNFTDYDKTYRIWFLIIPGVFVSLIYGFIKGRSQKVYTYADRIYAWIWIGFLLTGIILFILLSKVMGSVGPFIMLFAGYATFLSGIVIKFRPLIIGGIFFWAFALIAYFIPSSIAPLTVPLAMITGYLIPGHLLKKRFDHDTL